MHPEAITLKQKKIFEKLKNFSDYYLAGGTALALQIGHRLSIDFDFFSGKEIPSKLLPKIKKIFQDFKIEVVIDHAEQLTVRLNGMTLTFAKYPFPPLFKLEKYKGVKLLSISDIAATKAYVLGRRATLKDYIDLYYILRGGYLTLEKLIKIAAKKYKEFNPRLFLEQLIYLEDVEDIKIQFLKTGVSKKEIKNFFQNQIKKVNL